ncbi:hypothetical protein [Mycolicibacterium bacteremicum]|uniref:hypothetical protein n=1 Tax=Mycolicibacterium bacteremicum TaxID=564198 RepID=UPI0026EC96F8|nr:hypothetical protein [Mycolicibacterium bacteremicum]
MNKPISLTAGACSLCITATMIAAPPQAAAAAATPQIQHRSVSTLDQPYQLTAASVALQNLLLVAGIPFNNLNTTLTTLGGLTNFVTGLNQALGNIYKGNWDLVPANLQKAWTDEVAAFQKVLQLPQTLIEYDTRTIQNFVNSLGGSSPSTVRSAAAVSPAALPAARTDVTNALLVVLGIPFNNLNTTLTTLGGLTNFVTGLNQALGNIYKGNWDLVPANLQKAWTDEVAAFQKVLQLPQTIVTYNIKALQNLVGGLAPAPTSTFVTGERVISLALPAVAAPDDAARDTGPVRDTADTEDEATTTAPTAGGPATGAAAEEITTTPSGDAVTAEPTRSEIPASEETAAAEEQPDAAPDTADPKPGSEAPNRPESVHAESAGADESPTPAAAGGEHVRGGHDDDAPYGKHARHDDADSTAVSSGPGRHRKPEAGSGSASSASSASGSSTSGPSSAASGAAA